MAENQKNPNGFSPRTNGGKHGKRKLNKDGVLALIFLALIVIIIVAIVIIMVNAISGTKKDPDSTDPVIPIGSSTEPTGYTGTQPSEPAGSSEPTPSETTLPSVPVEGYSTVYFSQSEVYTGDLILVNDLYRYHTPDAKDSRLVSLYNQAGFKSVYRLKNAHVALSVDIIYDFANMLSSLKATFASRSLSSDILLIQSAAVVNDPASVPATSDENISGLAFDIRVLFTEGEQAGKNRRLNEDEQKWLAENCAAYGFVIRYGEGKQDITGKTTDLFHFRYVGTPHSLYMKANGLCLEEYIDLVSSYTYDKPLNIKVGSSSYSVYFVKSTGATTSVKVPVGAEYTVSGNNINGFIVTVKN